MTTVGKFLLKSIIALYRYADLQCLEVQSSPGLKKQSLTLVS